MKLAHLDMDGEKITIKLYGESIGGESVHIDIPDYDLTEGIYLSREHAHILGLALISIAKED